MTNEPTKMWDEAMKAMTQALAAPLAGGKTRTYDPMAVANAMNDFAFRMAARPETLVSATIRVRSNGPTSG